MACKPMKVNSMDEYGKRAWSGALIAVYVGSAIGGGVVVRHECRDIKADASCREPSDAAPHNSSYGAANYATAFATTTGTAPTTR